VLTTQKPCQYCKGAKAVQGTTGAIQKCPVCDGSGRSYDPGLQYTYRMTPVGLLALQAQSQFITINNYDFRWLELTGSYGYNGNLFALPFTFFITDKGRTRQFGNAPVHVNEMVGSGIAPFPILTPYVFPVKGQIQVDLVDLGAGAASPWSAVPTYQPGAIVTSGGNYYICVAVTTNNVPPNTTFWAPYVNTVALDFIGVNLGETESS
jgi:hypothetical protein